MASSQRPVIGINVDVVAATKNTASYIRLASGYFDSVYAAGGLPILIPPLNKGDELDTILDKLDGIVMGGGLDLDPRRSNLPTHNTVVPMAARREENDRLLMRRVLDRKMPLLAIGVGIGMAKLVEIPALRLRDRIVPSERRERVEVSGVVTA